MQQVLPGMVQFWIWELARLQKWCMHVCGGCSQALVFVVPRDSLKRLGLEVRPRCAGENARVFACMRALAQKDARTQWFMEVNMNGML